VAGTGPANRAEEIAVGSWFAHLDDDEIWTPDHLSSLLQFAQAHDHEYVWAQTCYEFAPGKWRAEGSDEPLAFDVPHSTMLYRSYLRCFPFDINAWRHGLGGDRHRLRRMHLAGVWCGFLRQIVAHAPLRPDTTRPWAEAEDRR
jgi:hypothetical protein